MALVHPAVWNDVGMLPVVEQDGGLVRKLKVCMTALTDELKLGVNVAAMIDPNAPQLRP